MRLAIFSDIHGNALALEAVLREIDLIRPDQLACGGDLVGYGACPNEVINLLRERRLPTVLGNYDEGVGFDLPDCGCAYRDPGQAALGHRSLLWTQSAVTPENKAFLRALPRRLELGAESRRILLVHGSPRKINEYLFADRPEASLARIFAAEKAEIIICGHTHLPYVRRIGPATLINCGSVGKPKDGDPRAAYILIEIGGGEIKTEIRRVEYDVESMARAIEETDLPREFASSLRQAGP